jgi:hypothetical protein
MSLLEQIEKFYSDMFDVLFGHIKYLDEDNK